MQPRNIRSIMFWDQGVAAFYFTRFNFEILTEKPPVFSEIIWFTFIFL